MCEKCKRQAVSDTFVKKRTQSLDNTRTSLQQCRTDESDGQLEPCRKKQNSEGRKRPKNRAAGKHEPSQHKQKEGRRFHQATAKIVEDFPLGNNGQGIVDLLSRLVGNTRAQPSCNLPITAEPAMFTSIEGAVM